MRSTMTFSRGGNSITVNTPQFGYKSEIHLALAIGDRRSNGDRPIFDEGRSNDTRLFVGNVHYPQDQQQEIQRFVRDHTRGRGVECQLDVGPGIFPFGPDCGTGRFSVRIVDWTFGPADDAPWLWFKSTITLTARAPGRRIPDRLRIGRGPLTIGTVDGLRFPPSFYDSACGYGFQPVATRGGAGGAMDSGPTSDWWETDVDVAGNRDDAIRLCDYLSNGIGGRYAWSGSRLTSAFRMVCGANSFAFGRDQCSADGSGTYLVNLRDKVIEVMHVSHDNYVIRLPLTCTRWLESGSLSLSSVSASISGSKSSASVSGSSVSTSLSMSSNSNSSLSNSSPSNSSSSTESSSSSSSLWAYF